MEDLYRKCCCLNLLNSLIEVSILKQYTGDFSVEETNPWVGLHYGG